MRREAQAGGTRLRDEVTVFVVDPSTRGGGVGKHLFSGFVEHLRRAGRPSLYLWTDSLCSFGFYERQGMRRTGSRDVDLDLAGMPSRVGVYLYTGAVPQAA